MPPQQATTGHALMERVERTEVVMVCPKQRAGFAQQTSYAMEVDRSNRNCYNYGGFGHLARHCRNKGIEEKIGQGRRLEYGNESNRKTKGGNGQENLNGEQDLILLD